MRSWSRSEAHLMKPERPQPAETMPEWLLHLLVCPLDQSDLELQSESLVCVSCGRSYPIRDGIPIMIPEPANTEL
jgi:uncharacterized protein YbaR (Trm112 family)